MELPLTDHSMVGCCNNIFHCFNNLEQELGEGSYHSYHDPALTVSDKRKSVCQVNNYFNFD